MPISFIGSVAVDDTGLTASRDLVVPIGVLPTHLGFIMSASAAISDANSVATGWTSRSTGTMTGCTFTLLMRLGGHTAGDVITVTTASSPVQSTCGYWFDTGGLDFKTAGTLTSKTAQTSTQLAASITTTAPNQPVMVFIVSRSNPIAALTSWTGSLPTPTQADFHQDGSGGWTNASMYCGYLLVPNPGSLGNRTANFDQVGDSGWGQMIGLQPPPVWPIKLGRITRLPAIQRAASY